MKHFALAALMLVLGFTFGINEAEAGKRFGGARSSGMQRQMAPPAKAPAASNATNPSNAAAMPQAQPKRSWMGPIAGLAAGLGIAALASHFGFGEGLANMMMIGLLVMAVMAAVGYFMRRRAGSQPPGRANSALQFATAGVNPAVAPQRTFDASMPPSGSAVSTLDGLDHEGFLRNAKVLFIRLQAANDSANLADIREFTTPEMFAEVRMEIAERGESAQQTDVLNVNAELLEFVKEEDRQIASVRFNAMLREGEAPTEAIEEIWHLVLPRGRKTWCLAGIQQLQ